MSEEDQPWYKRKESLRTRIWFFIAFSAIIEIIVLIIYLVDKTQENLVMLIVLSSFIVLSALIIALAVIIQKRKKDKNVTEFSQN